MPYEKPDPKSGIRNRREVIHRNSASRVDLFPRKSEICTGFAVGKIAQIAVPQRCWVGGESAGAPPARRTLCVDRRRVGHQEGIGWLDDQKNSSCREGEAILGSERLRPRWMLCRNRAKLVKLYHRRPSTAASLRVCVRALLSRGQTGGNRKSAPAVFKGNPRGRVA